MIDSSTGHKNTPMETVTQARWYEPDHDDDTFAPDSYISNHIVTSYWQLMTGKIRNSIQKRRKLCDPNRESWENK